MVRTIIDSSIKKRRIDWAKYTDFRSKHSKDDLAQICARLKGRRLATVFETYDVTGLCPIHWAAINNRSDLIEFMADNGSPLRTKCRNKLFADGTALHLAAMNGSLEAASMLLYKDSQTNRRESFPLLTEKTDDKTQENSREPPIRWLDERDADGQTPLMRSAGPRSKRMDLLRDLLRKNTWSLSSRPSEMALFLINKGADQNQIEPTFSMNLLHLAIANDYDDIVNLLIAIDRDMLYTKTKMRNRSSETIDKSATDPNPSEEVRLIDTIKRPIISRQEVAEGLLSGGLSPLQLAIVYGRLGIICLLWHYYPKIDRPSDSLRDTLIKVASTNRGEVIRLSRGAFLKLLLILDVAALILFWIPVYLPASDDDTMRIDFRAGTFLLSLCAALALCIRVASKEPGYLPRDHQEYYEELSKLSRIHIVGKAKPKSSSNESETKSDEVQGDTKVETRVRLLCHRCHTIRRPRTRHCTSCNRCIQDFDHHCIYLSCCIGKENRLDFLLMLGAVSVTAIYGSIIQGVSMNRAQWAGVWHFIGFLWICKYALIGGLSVFCMLRRACLGITMYEEIRSRMIRRIFGPKGTPLEINKSHGVYSISKDSIWRYSHSRFPSTGQSLKEMYSNLSEFVNLSNPLDYFLKLFCPDALISKALIQTN